MERVIHAIRTDDGDKRRTSHGVDGHKRPLGGIRTNRTRGPRAGQTTRHSKACGGLYVPMEFDDFAMPGSSRRRPTDSAASTTAHGYGAPCRAVEKLGWPRSSKIN